MVGAKHGGVRIFLSHAGADTFEASLLQYAAEHLLTPLNAKVWTYRRDQNKDQRDVAGNLKEQIRHSNAFIILVSPATLESGSTQWMEFAYADAFEVPISILLHRVKFPDLAASSGKVPPLLLASQCNDAALDWKHVIDALGERLGHAIGTGG